MYIQKWKENLTGLAPLMKRFLLLTNSKSYLIRKRQNFLKKIYPDPVDFY